jgi:cystathionine beta-lyase
MNKFDIIHDNYKDSFIKSNPATLRSLFGATDLMPLWIADMDFKIAQEITEEFQRLIDRGIYAYEFRTDEVFKAISDWNFKRNQLKLNKKAFVQVTGVLTGITILIRQLSKVGDGILVQSPVYHQFYKIIKNSNRKIISNPLKKIDGRYEMDFEDLEQKIQSENIKIMLLCNPHNPVGRVWSRSELQKLIDLANIYNFTIISDEIHSDIIFSKTTFNSIASFNQEKHISVLGSPAKTFGMQSIANGYLYIPNHKLHHQIKQEISSLYLDHGNAFTAFATIAAYTKGEKWVNELVEYLEKTVNWIQEFIKHQLQGVQLIVPEGTYQIWLDFSHLQLNETKLKKLVFEKAKLALAPGLWFDKNQPQFMRMNIASPLTQIQQAFNQLKLAIHESI